MGRGWREEEGARKLLNIQGLFPTSLRVVHPSKEEVRIKHQEVYMEKQGPPGQTQTQKGNLQRVEARTWDECRYSI